MRTENLICGGCSIDEEEQKVIQPTINKVCDSVSELITAIKGIRQDTGMSKEATIALIMHDVEWLVQEIACDIECEDLLDDYATDDDDKKYRECMNYYNQLKDNHELYSKKVFKKED